MLANGYYADAVGWDKCPASLALTILLSPARSVGRPRTKPMVLNLICHYIRGPPTFHARDNKSRCSNIGNHVGNHVG